MSIKELFEKHEDEYLKFDRVDNKTSGRSDLHAMFLLDRLFPSDSDIVSAAEHDEIWLDVPEYKIKTLTEDQVIELIRCGVRYSGEFSSLCMFV